MVNSRLLCVGLGLLAGLACQRPPKQLATGLSVASQAPPSSLLRLPAAGGSARVYRVPTLAEAAWKSQASLPPLRRPIGVDLDQGVAYALGGKNEVVALDLQTGRVRPTPVPAVREAVIGPDGVLYTVDDSNTVVEIMRRNPVRFNTRLPGRPRDLFGTKDDQVIAVTTGAENQLTVASSDQPSVSVSIPRGDAAATLWGDLIAIAADSAVIFYEPRAKEPTRVIPVEGHARAVIFSPSGHRLYVARRAGGILVLNRFTYEPLGELRLPGPAGALRPDPYGRWLLVHPPAADSVWVVDLATGRYIGGFASGWSADLPTVTNQQTLLVKQEGDVVAFDLAQANHPRVGRVNGGAKDLWLPLAWTPETGTAAPETTEPVIPASSDSTGPGTNVFLQISSSQNPDWAANLAQQLTEAGLPASVIKPRTEGEGYRVVLGPYPSREEAEEAGRKLGRPFFIYQPDRTTPGP